MTAVHPGGAPNTFVPSTEATNNMIVDFSRNVDSFAINKWLYMIPVDKGLGYYTEMTVEEAGRMLQSDAKDDLWADGEDAPDDRGRTEKFEFKPFTTKRYRRGYRIGGKAKEQASWDIIAQHGRITAQHAMTRRTQIATALVQTTGNWPAANTIAVSSISGVVGKWDQSTTARLDIKKSLRYGMQTIQKQTLGAIAMKDLKLVLGPDTAAAISETQELADFIKGSPDALAYLKGELGPNSQYGLPKYLYGVELIIEDAVKVTTRKGAASTTKSYVWDGDKPALLYRAGGSKDSGGLVGPENSNEAPTFSTVTCFMYEEMSVESKYDADNRVHKGRIVEDFDTKLTAGISGFLFQDALT